MSYERQPGDGILFRNTKKTSEKQPDYRGEGLGGCPHCGKSHPVEIAAWEKTSAKGSQFLTLKTQPARPAPEGRPGPPPKGAAAPRRAGPPPPKPGASTATAPPLNDPRPEGALPGEEDDDDVPF